MNHAHVLKGAALLCAAGLAQPLWAQAVQQVQGTLARSDPSEADGRPYDDHRLRLEAGTRYRISVSSSDFDTLIRLYGPGGGGALAEDDDGGEGSNSSLVFSARERGEYRLRVTGYNSDSLGAYSGSVRALAPLKPPVTRPSGSGSMNVDVFTGRLEEDTDGEPGVADFLVRIDSGQTIWAGAKSADFDTVLKLYRAGELDDEPIVSNDDAGGSDSLLQFTPDYGGEYILRVTSFNGGSGGAFTLQVAR